MLSYIFKALKAVACLLCWASLAHGATYYVRAGGTDDGGCVANNPSHRRNTINKAIACMNACDTVIVGDGTYVEMLLNDAPGGYPPNHFNIPSGNASCRTTVQAENTYGAILGHPAPFSEFTNYHLVSSGSYIHIEGFVFNGYDHAMLGAMDLGNTTGHHRRFKDIHIKNTLQGGSGGAYVNEEFYNFSGEGLAWDNTTNTTTCPAYICAPDDFEGRCPGACHLHYPSPGNDTIYDGGHVEGMDGELVRQNGGGDNIMRNMSCNKCAYLTNTGDRTKVYNNVGTNLFWGGIHAAADNDVYHNTLCLRAPTTYFGQEQFSLFGIKQSTPGIPSRVKNNLLCDLQNGPSGDYISVLDSGGNEMAGNSGLVSGNVCDSNQPGCQFHAPSSVFITNAATGNATLPSNSVAINAANALSGLSFSITPDKAGTARPFGPGWDAGAYEFTAADPPVATALQFTTQPANVGAGQPITPAVVVRVVDQFGAHFPSATHVIAMAIGANPGSSTLSGSTSVMHGTGGAIFSTLTLNNLGVGYTLVASSGELTPATSTAFTVIVPPPTIPATPTNARSLEQTVTATGAIRVGWDYMQSANRAKSFKVYQQPACSGGFTPVAQQPMPLRGEGGVNLSGAEVGPLPGVHGTNYVYPDPDFAPGYTGQTYFDGKGMTTVRLPFRWERLQPTLNGALVDPELTRLSETVGHLTTLGLRTVLVPFAARIIGSGGVTQAHFENFWSQLGAWFAGDFSANFVNMGIDFDLLQEPTGLTTEAWAAAAQAAINAIRTTGAKNRILVQGLGGSAPQQWTTGGVYGGGTANSTALAGLTDPDTHLAYSVHLDLDAAAPPSPGTGACVSTTIGAERLAPFTTWLRSTTKKGHVGEFAVINSPTCTAAMQGALQHMRTNSDVLAGWQWWAGGPPLAAVPAGLNLEPTGALDKPQMDVLEPYLAEIAATAQTYTVSGLASGSTTCWQVRAVAPNGDESDASNTVSWTVPTEVAPPGALTLSTFSSGLFAK